VDLARIQHLGPGHGQRQHDGVARGDIGDRDAFAGLGLAVPGGHGDGFIGECRAADAAQVHMHDAMFARALDMRDPRGGIELGLMALTV
jgi:hypothetical protein